MARDFDDAVPDYLRTTAFTLQFPFTVSAWINPDDLADLYCWVSSSREANDFDFHMMDTDTSGFLRARSRRGSNNRTATTSNTLTAGAWSHGCIIYTSSTNRTVVLNGDWDNRGVDTSSSAPTNLENFTVGARRRQNVGPASDGQIAEVGVWDTSLAQAEVEMLAASISPLLIRPESLTHYYPLIGRTSPEIDIVGGDDLTLFGTPSASPHCRIFYPARSQVGVPSTAPAPTFQPAWASGLVHHDGVPVC